MSYYNGKDILPKDLIDAIQVYFDGGYIYIPRKADNKKLWGEANGSRQRFSDRNAEIFAKYKAGVSVSNLSEQYFLSVKTIYSIISEMKKLC